MSPSQQPTSLNNPAYLKNQFAHRFIRALNNLHHTKTPPHHNYKMYNRSTRVKIAANTAMASVVGSRRAWSRAVLWKIRKLRSRKRVNCHHQEKVSLKRRNPKPKTEDFNNPFGDSSQESKLRELVPGGETLDAVCLMGETANYIKCLVAQVEVMKTLVDLYNPT
ncbi:hypothetical protein SSX86_022305 [Deinandra increscens subsp. villosa]|uniref:IBH1-like N-terminal domain-containing protein n=1 Tax=Deinandra increscens subsp. villosa TaxID=3103831 RepID=A0AAP0CNS9_9ASTR